MFFIFYENLSVFWFLEEIEFLIIGYMVVVIVVLVFDVIEFYV